MRSARIEQVISNLKLRRPVLLDKPENCRCPTQRAKRDRHQAVRTGVAAWKDLVVIWVPRARTCIDFGVIRGGLAAGAEPEVVHQVWREYLRHTENERVCVNAIALAIRHIHNEYRLVAHRRSVIDAGKE